MPSADMKEHEVRYDYTNMMSEAVGEHGVAEDDVAAVSSRLGAAFEILARQRAEGVLGFEDLPYDDATAGLVMKTAAALEGRFEEMVLLGIGGSALGPTALKSALCRPFHNLLDSAKRKGRPRLFVLDNIDPDQIAAVMEMVEPKKTLVNVVTKSGGTAETISQLVIFHEMMSRALGAEASDHFVATTDPQKGALRKMAKEFGWRTLPIAPNVGGRFSVLTPVGLFPAAMLGLNVRQLLSGAAFMDRRSEAQSVETNAALAYAVLQYALGIASHAIR